MGKTRDVVERFYQRFGANDLDGAFGCFAPECILVGLSGPLNNSAHHAAALALKNAVLDCHMESSPSVAALSLESRYVPMQHFVPHRLA